MFHLNKHSRPERPKSVLGFLLEVGDVLEPTDVYASTDGTWDPCPCPGLKLHDGVKVMWVRPDRS